MTVCETCLNDMNPNDQHVLLVCERCTSFTHLVLNSRQQDLVRNALRNFADRMMEQEVTDEVLAIVEMMK